MDTPVAYYALLLFAGATISLTLAVMAWQRRREAGATAFTIAMLGVATWSFAYGLEIMGETLADKLIWHKIIYSMAPLIPSFWLLFLLQQKPHSLRMMRVVRILLLTGTIVYTLLTWNNDQLHWLWREIGVRNTPGFPHLVLDRAIGFYIQLAASYTVTLIATGMLMRMLLTGVPLPRWQVIIVSLGVVSPIIANFIHHVGLNPLYPLNLTPFALVSMGAAAGWYIFRFRVWDLLPAAHNAIVESMNDGVIVLNLRNQIVEINPAALRLLDLPHRELEGRSVAAVLSHVAQPDNVYALLNADEVAPGVGVEIVLAEPHQRTVEVYLSHLYNRNKQITGRLLTLRDITARKCAEQALVDERALLAQHVAERTADLREANARLMHVALLKDEFLANISHELRTPLNAILGLSESLQEEVYGALNENQSKALHKVETSGRHLLALINDILEITNIGAGRVTLELSPVAIDAVCQASLESVAQAALKRRIAVIVNLDPSITAPHSSFILADEHRLRQMLVNLLGNAVKFTSPGGKVGLEVTGDRRMQLLYFTVWDSGIGIAPADIKRLFQPFVQLDSRLARAYDGTGLGLALAYQIAELHGGHISVESEVGVGSRFLVTLPWQTTDGRSEITDYQRQMVAQ